MLLLWSLVRSTVDAFKHSALNWLSRPNTGSSPRKRNLEMWDEDLVPSPKLRRTRSLPAMQRGGRVGDTTGSKDGFVDEKVKKSPKLEKKEREKLMYLEGCSCTPGRGTCKEEQQPRCSERLSRSEGDGDVELLHFAQKSPKIGSQPSANTLTKLVLAKRGVSVVPGKGAIPRTSSSSKCLPPERREEKFSEHVQLGEKMEYLQLLQELTPSQRKEQSSCTDLSRDNVLCTSTGKSCVSSMSLLDGNKPKNTGKCVVYDCSWMAEFVAEERAKVHKSRLEERLKGRSKKSVSKEPLPLTLEQQLKQQLKITSESIKEENKCCHCAFTPEMEELVDEAFKSGPGLEVMVQSNGVVVTRKDIHTLIDGNWLNDEVVNFYMILLEERGRSTEYPSVYCFNTFFYPKLSSSGHDSVKRWTSKVDIFNQELLVIPVHLGLHWCVACVDFQSKEVLYFDSMGVNNRKCLKHIVKYLQAESMDKKQKLFDMRSWHAVNMKNIPQQMNGSDCGVFSCMYAEYVCRRAKIMFSQADMPFFRRKMACEILTKKLLQ